MKGKDYCKMNDTNRINDNRLTEVVGGSAGIHNLSVSVDLPPITDDVTFKVYFDGLLELSKTIKPAFLGCYTLTFSAAGGKSIVDVNINDLLYRKYEFDFDNNTVLQIR